jgi:prolipoprotein diacylglyceryltransferase
MLFGINPCVHGIELSALCQRFVEMKRLAGRRPLLLAILWAVRNRLRPREGRTAALFLILLYGLFRFAIEFTREPDLQLGFIAFGWLTMGQLLSALLAGAGIVLWFMAARRVDPQPDTPVGI